MTFKDIQELLRLVNRLELAEFKMQDGEFRLSVRTKHYQGDAPAVAHHPAAAPGPAQVAPAPAAPPPAAAAPPTAQKAEEKPGGTDKKEDTSRYVPVKSPMVGTFYRSPSPDKAAFVKVGDDIEPGMVVCIVEAMKLFNEIESEVAGKIVKVMIEDAQPVEYDQVLFLVEPKG
jgi:acetyl-CoA carboxylase biotin carboxyl carrier protein